MTIPGVSNWFEWTWPIEGEDAGYIKARAIPNIGNWVSFSPAQIQKFVKDEINQPSPQVSESTESKSLWKIPIPHASGKVVYDRMLCGLIKISDFTHHTPIIFITYLYIF